MESEHSPKYKVFILRTSIPQVMVNSEVSGVAFSRHPLKPLSANCVFVEAVYGLGEGLVSGELQADSYEVCVCRV